MADEDITFDDLDSATLMASGIAGDATGYVDHSGLAGPSSRYAVVGHYEDRGPVLLSNSATVRLPQAEVTELVLDDDFEDGDFTGDPAWTVAYGDGAGVFVEPWEGSLAMRLQSASLVRPFATTGAAIGDANYELSFRTRLSSSATQVFFRDDSGRVAYRFSLRAGRYRLKMTYFDAAGDSIGAENLFAVDTDWVDAREFTLERSGGFYSLVRDGELLASQAVEFPDDQWHDNIVEITFMRGSYGVYSSAYVDDVRLMVDTGDRNPANTLACDALLVNGEAVPVEEPVAVIDPGTTVDVEAVVRLQRATETAAIMPLFLVRSWSEQSEQCERLVYDLASDAADTVSFTLTVPESEGTYYALLSSFNEGRVDQHVSATSWAFAGAPVWGDGNDLNALDAAGVMQDASDGSVQVPYAGYDGPANLAARVLVLQVQSTTSVGEVSLPPVPTITAAYPNPFNPDVCIEFAVPSASRVRVRVVNPRGEVVRSLLEDHVAGGRHDVWWNGRDMHGRPVSSGRYICLLETPAGTTSAPLTLVK